MYKNKNEYDESEESDIHNEKKVSNDISENETDKEEMMSMPKLGVTEEQTSD
jgi:hypothetical protein